MLSKRKARQATQRYHFLRQEVQDMPLGMAGAMLQSLDEMTIVTGQYTDSRGGSCPLLAAWQSSKYTVTLKHTFPATWDVFCGVNHPRKARPATPHEVRMLRMLLEERLMPPGERPLVDQLPETPDMPLVVPQPAPVEVLQAEETPAWSCDWEAELQQLYSQQSFIRPRRVTPASTQDVGSPEWVSCTRQIMHGLQPVSAEQPQVLA